MKLINYESTNVTMGYCVKKYTSSSMEGGMQSFYGQGYSWEEDLCGPKKDSAACAASNGCSWISLSTCAANNATSSYCGYSLKEHSTNTAKTKFYINGSDSKFDICGRHRNSNPMCGDGRCDEVWTASCLVPFCDPKEITSGDSKGKNTKLVWTKVSENTICPSDCATVTSCDSKNKVLLGYDANKVSGALCSETCSDNDNEYYEYEPTTKNGEVSIDILLFVPIKKCKVLFNKFF